MSILSKTPAGAPRSNFEGQWLSLLIVLVLTLLAKGPALLPGYSIDDYQPANDGPSALLSDVLSKGRVGHWAFLKAAMAFQVEPNAAQIFFVFLSIIAYAAFGLAVVRFWGIQGNGWLPVAAAAIVANHPYTSEIFTFRIGLAPAAIVMALLSLLLFLASRPQLFLVLGSLVFASAISFYPIALHFGAMILLVGLAIELCRYLITRSAPGENSVSAPWLDRRRLLAARNTHLFLFILLGVLSYTLAVSLLGKLIGVSSGYFETLPLSRIPERILIAGKLIAGTFVSRNVLIPRTVQIAFLLVVACFLTGLLRIIFSRPVRGSSFLIFFGIVSLLGCAWLWSVGVVLFRQEYWPVPRTMAHVGIFWAGCLVLAALTAQRSWTRRGLSLAAALIILSFIGASQHIFDEQWRLYMRDRYKANRIVARLEAMPGFEGVRRIAFVGLAPFYPGGLQRTQWGDMNISAFGATWSQVSLVREFSGYNVQSLTEPQERAAAEAYCAHAELWPDPTSVTIRGELGIVCLIR